LTVIIGIVCEDGVVVGSHSSATYGPNDLIKTIEHNALKIEILRGNVITATTGAVGLAQRFCEQAEKFFELINAPYTPAPIPQGFPLGMIPQMPMQQALSRVPAGKTPLSVLSAIEIGTMLSESTIANFRRTALIVQANQGLGLGLSCSVRKQRTTTFRI
jgi:Proteasome subunit